MVKTITAKASLAWLKKLDKSYVFIWLLSIAAAVFLLTWDLSSLTYHQISPLELSTLLASSSWHNLLANPLFLPYKIVEYFVLQLGGTGHVFIIRLVTVFYSLVSIWLFLSIARRWFNKPTYVLATILFGSSLWVLHFGRLVTPTILLVLTPLIVIRTILWIQSLKKGQATTSYRLTIFLPVIFGLSLYVPGAWLLWFAPAIWHRKKITLLAKKLPWQMSLAAISLTLVILAPLAYGLASNTSLIYDWLGVQRAGFVDLARLKLFGLQPLYYLGYGPPASPAQWLERQPILDVFSETMALLGLGFYAYNYKLRQAKFLLVTLASGLILFVISGGGLDVWAGLVYLLAAAGIGYMLQTWRKVFPRNPVAYGGAVLLISLATAAAVFYTTRSYFVGWHYHPETVKAFSIKI